MFALHTSTPLAFAMIANLISATAVPSQWGCPKGQVKYTTAQDANFDDLQTVPVGTPNSIPTPYKGLFFQAFQLINVVPTGLLPIAIPHSAPNFAGTGVVGETTGGDPMITVNYQNVDPNLKSFDLSSFYYSCLVDVDNGATDPPTDCRLTFTGFSGNDNTISDSTQVCSKSFEYHPTTMAGPQQQAFTGAISGCTGLTHGVFTFQPMGGAQATASLLSLQIDDVKYGLNSCKKA